MGIAGVWYRLIGIIWRSSSMQIDQNPACPVLDDDLVSRALKAVFGMDNNGKIKKEKARLVVKKLGLMQTQEDEDDDEDEGSFDLPGNCDDDEVRVDDVLIGMEEDEKKRIEMLREAFTVFDKDGDGYIEAMELKRVLECLGLDKGWDMEEIEKMVEVADLNLDGKVDFGEFELMMG